MKQLKVMLWFDVEDFITPEADDALLALIDMMDSIHTIAVAELLRTKDVQKKTLNLTPKTDELMNIGVTEISMQPINLWEVLSSMAHLPTTSVRFLWDLSTTHVICNLCRAEIIPLSATACKL